MTKVYLTLREKKIIVDEAYSRRNNIKPTADKYVIQPSQIRRWKKHIDSILFQSDLSDSKIEHVLTLKSTQKGAPMKDDDEVYSKLRKFYDDTRNNGRVVTVNMLCYEMKRITGSESRISILRHRVRRWLGREQIVQRRVTHIAQNTRHDVSKMEGFVKYVNEQIVCGRFLKANVVNIDETNIYFDMVGKITLADRGQKTVSVSSTGSSSRCTILLGVTMDGTKLPPFVIFKGKQGGRITKEWSARNTEYPTTAFYTVQEKAWIDKRVFIEWVEKVWKPYCDNKANTYLLMDEFSVHLMTDCVRAIQDCGTEIDYILGGYTSKLQVLDVGVNKPFKDYIKDCYERFMVENGDGAKVSRTHVAKWVDEAWNRVSSDTICNTWRSIGFVNTN